MRPPSAEAIFRGNLSQTGSERVLTRMKASSALEIIGGGLVITERLTGEWEEWDAAFSRLSDGAIDRVIAFEHLSTRHVFAVGAGTHTVHLAGGSPAVAVRCRGPQDLAANHAWLETALSQEGAKRKDHGAEIWARDERTGLNALLPIRLVRRLDARRPTCS